MLLDQPEFFQEQRDFSPDEGLPFANPEIPTDTFTGIEFGLFPSPESRDPKLKTKSFTELIGTGALLTYKTASGTLDGNDILMGALSLTPLAAAKLLKYTGIGAKIATPVRNALGRLDNALTGGRIKGIIANFEKKMAERAGKNAAKVSGQMDEISQSTGRITRQAGEIEIAVTDAAIKSLKMLDETAKQSLLRINQRSALIGSRLYNGITKTGLTGDRMNALIKTTEEFLDQGTDGFTEVMRRFAAGDGEIGAAFELEVAGSRGVKNVNAVGKQITTSARSGDIDVILKDNTFIEVKGGDLSKITKFDREFNSEITGKVQLYEAYMKDNNIQGTMEFVFKTKPSDDIINFLGEKGINWGILP